MDQNYFFYYVESMAVCIIILGILLIYDIVKGDRQYLNIQFDNVLWTHMIYFLCDGFWAALTTKLLPQTPLSVLLVNYCLFVALSMIGYEWFLYSAAMENMPRWNTKRGRWITAIPFFVSITVVLVGMLINPSAWLNDDITNTSTLFNLFFLGIPIIYVICAFLFSMTQAFRKENRINRGLYLFIGIYPLGIVVAGLIQTLYSHMPIFCFATTIMVLLLDKISMDHQVSVDPLTQLNNRRRLIRYVAQDAALHKDGQRTYAVMADVNDFKKINDTYGHAEGDRVLVMIADTLKHAAEQMEIPLFLGRYGGDEFVMIVYTPADSDGTSVLERMIRFITEEIETQCRREQTPYMISLSFGYEETLPEDAFDASIRRADEHLYANKAKFKAAARG